MSPAAPIFAPEAAPLRVGVLLMSDCNALALASCVDPMRAANRRAGKTLYTWAFHSESGGDIRVTAGFSVPTTALPDRADFDVLMIVAGFRVSEQATPALLARLRRLAPQVRAMVGIDGGPWFPALAGLLDGQTATVHWEDLETFATRFPEITVLRDRYVISGRMITTGGAGPCLDMMIELIRARQGPELALRVASAFVYEPLLAAASPQKAIATARLARADPALGRAIGLMEAHVEHPLPITEIARRIGLSARRLEMLFARHLGLAPGRFFLDLRLDEARRMVTDTDMPLHEVALCTGFSSQMTFARAFRARFGTTALSLRKAASPHRPPAPDKAAKPGVGQA